MADVVNLSHQQNSVYQTIIDSISTLPTNRNQNVFLIKGAAGTGKTFLLNQIWRHCQNEDIKVIALGYTGIASCMLLKGRTVHSQFRIPWNRQQISCAIDSNSPVYKHIKQASVLLWDQAAFCSRLIIEEVNRFLKEMMNSNRLFGGKIVVMCADFRECTPIASSTEPPESHSILFSPLFRQMQHFILKDNFRFTNHTDFRWCLDIGCGIQQHINIPNECRTNDLDTLIHSIYTRDFGSLSPDDVMQRSIVTVTTEAADLLNKRCFIRLIATKLTCPSINYFKKIDEDERSRYYDMESVMINLPKYFPPDILLLGENCPVILQQSYRGLSQGTRLIVKHIAENKIIAEIGVGQRKGRLINIYRTLTRRVFHAGNVQFIRRQFPISLAFALTINKAQGLQLNRLGVYFDSKIFAHGQMYVALSRVPTIKDDLKVFIAADSINCYDRMTNVVNSNIIKCLQD